MKYSLLLLLLCTSIAVQAQSYKPIQEAMSGYDYETALTLIEKEKASPTLLLLKSRALKSLNRYQDALAVLQQFMDEEPENQQGLIETAECYKATGQYNKALQYYEQSLALNPSNKYLQLQYLNLLCGLEQFNKAKQVCDELLVNDSSATSLHLQAQCLAGMKETEEAIGIYHILQEKYPDDYLSAAQLGNLYNDMKQYTRAIECTEAYRQRDSTNLMVNRQNALAYCLNKDYPQAIQRYDYLLQQGDSTYLTCYYAGVSNYAVEKYYDSHDLLEYAHQYEPQNVNLLYYLARSCAKTSWKKDGVKYIEQAIENTIPAPDVLVNLYKGANDCYRMANMYPEQIQALKEWYKNEPNNHRLLYDIAYIYGNLLKDNRSAEQYLEAFLKTKSKESKEKSAELNNQGEVVLGLTNYYNAASNWLNDLRKEKFFKEGAPKQQ